MSNPRPYPVVLRHGEIQMLFEDLFFVTGCVEFTKGLTGQVSRNMTIVRTGKKLTLINTVRLNENGLKELDLLGKVTDIIRLCSYHGMDDPFYKERYDAQVWSVDATYDASKEQIPKPGEIYFNPDIVLTSGSKIPIPDAEYIEFTSSNPKEAVLLLRKENGIIISGDSFQNMYFKDPFHNVFGKLMLKLGGFLKFYNIGPAWYRVAKPRKEEILSVLNREFQHLIPAHGNPVIGDAFNLYRPAVSGLREHIE